MTAGSKLQFVSPEDYLASELRSPVRREYVAGTVHAMTGGTNTHARISRNTLAALHNALGSGPCEAFAADTKIRIRNRRDVRFYYPDVSVVCEPNPGTDHFQDRPVLLVEVLSQSTRRIDDSEKREAYLTIPSLHYYLLFEQDSADAVVFRRNEEGFRRELVSGLDAVVELPALNIRLALADVYHRIQFAPETPEPSDI
jgi:Uma2 family endonuclease